MQVVARTGEPIDMGDEGMTINTRWRWYIKDASGEFVPSDLYVTAARYSALSPDEQACVRNQAVCALTVQVYGPGDWKAGQFTALEKPRATDSPYHYLTYEELTAIDEPTTVKVIARATEPRNTRMGHYTDKTEWSWEIKGRSGYFHYTALRVDIDQYQSMSSHERDIIFNRRECALTLEVQGRRNWKVIKIGSIQRPMTATDWLNCAVLSRHSYGTTTKADTRQGLAFERRQK